MGDEQNRIPLGEENSPYADQESAGHDEEEFQDYHKNSGQIDEKGQMENQEWSSGISERCNLIVNYLPHEIDDGTLKVTCGILGISDIYVYLSCVLLISLTSFICLQYSFQTLFTEHGDIAVAKVVKDKLTKKSLGFGFVKFLREDDAMAAIEAKNGFLMGPKKLKVSLARPPSIEIRNCKLYITNLPKEFTERDVTDLFNQVSIVILIVRNYFTYHS